MRRLRPPQAIYRIRPQHAFWVAALLAIAITVSSCAAPSQSASSKPVSPELKAQVLQIVRENPQVIVESVQAYQQQQQQQLQQARRSFLQQMIANPGSVIGDSPATGAAERKIVLVEFSDFQCPFCAKAHKTVKQFMDKYKDKVTLTYKHLPLTQIHQEALPAAKAAWAAQQQGKFWEYQEALFSQQEKLGEPLYVATAEGLKLDMTRFNRDRSGAAAEAAIQKDIQLAESLGINGTPFFTLNGETLSGAIELSEMEKTLERVRAGAPAAGK
ncbi:MAG: thioredoxin domain-containing protein [Oscillatoria princeps RMCB-10]|jgi:protein-disulfide isomerase|nr:thioredoxin domain-containing protein [Oscillatoria princeps RMCB-10]